MNKTFFLVHRFIVDERFITCCESAKSSKDATLCMLNAIFSFAFLYYFKHAITHHQSSIYETTENVLKQIIFRKKHEINVDNQHVLSVVFD
ncbi:CLUMA_CG012281, isoform A [Clunio marinus]|uniref:CLUMA_CG012281, isoform A n=1 Tax=Clunio marinus TaxID=568069 RepID=A0A1J1IEN2_9DIPT|nr:CLUMA_CG012281, isoform A [Clunio marinus]